MVHFGEGEEVIIEMHPSLKPPIGKLVLGILILVPGILYYFSGSRDVIIYILYFLGIFIFLYGMSELIVTLRTTYYVTNMRVLKEYKSPLRLEINEIPLNKIRGIKTKRDLSETIFRLGHIVIASGAGKYFEIHFKNIDDADKVAEKIRSLLKNV